MITCKNVNKEYRRGSEIVNALSSVNLEITEGEFIAVMGASGSGKTTLLNLVSGFDKPTSGEIKVMGKDLFALSDNLRSEFRNQHLGFVFQFFYLQSYNSLLENVLLPFLFETKKQTIFEQYKLARQAIQEVGLLERINHLPDELSGGERQRTAIARAIVKQPKILLLDEPTGNLDRTTSTQIMELFKNLHQNHKITIVLVTHDEQSAKYAQRTIKLDKGEIC